MQCIFANTPVVSPESKNPALAGFSLCSDCSLLFAAEWRSSAKHEWIIELFGLISSFSQVMSTIGS
ncbi:hypothetical protein [Enterobacter hormaechei]|uniref:hypothetical protein n=1 Tax=Enterobacter hormaechei TaxID=158836 RepID=UPI0034D2E8B9